MNQTHSPTHQPPAADTWCRDCSGDGTVFVEVTGGRFNLREQQWYPHEVAEPCDRCHGTGRIWIEELSETELEALHEHS